MNQFPKTLNAVQQRARNDCKDSFAVGDALADELGIEFRDVAKLMKTGPRKGLFKRLAVCAKELNDAGYRFYDEKTLSTYLNTSLRFPRESRDYSLSFVLFRDARTPENHDKALSVLKESGKKITSRSVREVLRQHGVVKEKKPPKGMDPQEYAEQRQIEKQEERPYAGLPGQIRKMAELTFKDTRAGFNEDLDRINDIIAKHAADLNEDDYGAMAEELLEIAEKARLLSQTFKQSGGPKKGFLSVAWSNDNK